MTSPMRDGETDGSGPVAEAKKSIRYMLRTALEYGHVPGFEALLDRVAALRQYKPYNALLILLQRPAASYVLPAHAWERHGYVIRPDEQPLVLLQPGGPVMFLFDASQTEPGPNADPNLVEKPFAMRATPHAGEALHWVIENAKADGVRVLPAGLGLTFAGCIWPSRSGVDQDVLVRLRPLSVRTVRVRYETLLNDAHTPTEQLATVAHELGHLFCGHLGEHDSDLWPEPMWPDRSALPHEQKELEAHSVARLVFRRIDPDNELPDYLSQYFKKVPLLPPGDLERVLTAAGRVLEMSAGHAPRRFRTKGNRPDAQP